MNISTVIGALLFGFLGTFTLGGWLNFPDAGAIFAIAFVGGKIVNIIETHFENK